MICVGLLPGPPLLKLVARAYADLLQPLTFDHLAAVPYGALAIGTAVSLLMERPFIFPRKEAKTHGTGRVIEGLFKAGDKVAVVEDLVTKGGSALKAIDTLEAADLTVSDVVVLIDREQGGQAALAEAGYQLHTVFVLSEILGILQDAGKISGSNVTAVQEYLATT